METSCATRIMRSSASAAMAISPGWAAGVGTRHGQGAGRDDVVGLIGLAARNGSVHRLDRRIRVQGLNPGRGPARGLPCSQGGFVHPQYQVAAPLQPGFVLSPVPDAVAGARDTVAALRSSGMPESVTAQPQVAIRPGPGAPLHQCHSR